MESKLLSPSSSRSRRHSKQLPLKEDKMLPCWADLSGDLLPIIAEKASTTNIQYVHLRAVCKAWRRALTPHPHHLPPQLPWLMLPQLPNDTRQRLGISDANVCFYDMARSKTYWFNLPYTSGKYYCGSSHGWLVLEDRLRVSLVNPITRRCIDLPSLDAPPTLLRVTRIERRSVPSNQHEEYRNCIRKASLSCTPFKPGCIVVAWFLSYTSNWELGFCRIGDSHWTGLKKSDLRPMLKNFTFYNNLIYTVNTEKEISVYDIQDCSVWTFPSKLNFYLCVRDQINFVGDAGSSGPLIVRMVKCFSERMVYVYKWCDDWQTWREVKDIGKRVLFLNERHSIILQCDEKQENKVYYDITNLSDPTMESFHVGLNQANLESGMVVPHELSWNSVYPLGFHLSGLPLWVTPSLI